MRLFVSLEIKYVGSGSISTPMSFASRSRMTALRDSSNNGLGYDRYAEIFDNKQYYGVLMKAKTLTAEQDEKFHHLRVATELALDGLNISSDERDRYSVLPLRDSSITENRPSVLVLVILAPSMVWACPIRKLNSWPMIRMEIIWLFILTNGRSCSKITNW